ncbi:hypothetical protein Q8F55_005176 [Vanrija albida]|uniref:Uncharacterized protein n=1 Tax=Vanrija albida TaxID=181172 RepID=A0ABR3Q109_9TREE
MGSCCSKPPPAPPPKNYLHNPYETFYGGSRPLPSGYGTEGPPAAPAAAAESSGAATTAEVSRSHPIFAQPASASARGVRFADPTPSAASRAQSQQSGNDLPFTPLDPFPPRRQSAKQQAHHNTDLPFQPLDPFPPLKRSASASAPSTASTTAGPDVLAGWAARGYDREAACRSLIERMTTASAPWADARAHATVKQLCAAADTCAIVVEVLKARLSLGGIQAAKAMYFLPPMPVAIIAQFVTELNKFVKDADDYYATHAANLRDRAIAAQAAIDSGNEANFVAYLASMGHSSARMMPGAGFGGARQLPGAFPGGYPWA